MSSACRPADTSFKEVRKTLLLILGCAVQCEQKEDVIENIKRLDIRVQEAMVEHIKQVGLPRLWVGGWTFACRRPVGSARSRLDVIPTMTRQFVLVWFSLTPSHHSVYLSAFFSIFAC